MRVAAQRGPTVADPRGCIAIARGDRGEAGVRGSAVRDQSHHLQITFARGGHCAAGMHDEGAFEPGLGVSGMRGDRAVAQPNRLA